MPWKTENGQIVVQDGNPVWIGADGKEAAADHGSALSRINELNTEAATRRRELTAATEKLKALDGIENPSEFIATARKAMETVKNLDDKKLIDAGEAEKVKAEVTKAMQAEIDKERRAREQAETTLDAEIRGGQFARSKFISEKLAVPSDMVQATFGHHFKREDGRLVGYDASGNKIYSRKPENVGNPAGFDEALEILVEQYPHKDHILKGSDARGSETPGGTITPAGGKLTPEQAGKLSQAEYMKARKEGRI